MGTLEYLLSTEPSALYRWGMLTRSLHISSSPSVASTLKQAIVEVASVNHHISEACVLKFVSIAYQSCPLSRLEKEAYFWLPQLKQSHTSFYQSLSVSSKMLRCLCLNFALLMRKQYLFWCLWQVSFTFTFEANDTNEASEAQLSSPPLVHCLCW